MFSITNQFPFANIGKLLIVKLSYFTFLLEVFIIYILYYTDKKIKEIKSH